MSLLPKPIKDYSEPSNFQSISIINNDLKIFSRLLANRLAAVISSPISLYQLCFISDRQITDIIKLATNIIQDSNRTSSTLLLLSLDIHKAFKSVTWEYLAAILQHLDFRGSSSMSLRLCIPIRKQESESQAVTDFFKVDKKGTRQGCSLPPYLHSLWNRWRQLVSNS